MFALTLKLLTKKRKEFPFALYDFFRYIANGLLIVDGLELIVGVPNDFGKDIPDEVPWV